MLSKNQKQKKYSNTPSTFTEVFDQMERNMFNSFARMNSIINNMDILEPSGMNSNTNVIKSIDYNLHGEFKDLGDKYLLSMELDKDKVKDITITIKKNKLNIKYEKKENINRNREGSIYKSKSIQSFSKIIQLPDNIIRNSLYAYYKDGYLKITVKKK